MYKRLSVYEIAEKYTPEDQYLLFGQFLDDFRNAEEEKYNLIKDEPPFKEGAELFLCILAAASHKLANDNGLPVPEWVYREQYIFKEIYYAHNTKIKGFRQHLEETSPKEFKQRNLMLGDNVLSRV